MFKHMKISTPITPMNLDHEMLDHLTINVRRVVKCDAKCSVLKLTALLDKYIGEAVDGQMYTFSCATKHFE